MRLIHAVRELAAETGDPDRDRRPATPTSTARATFVREADIAYDLGPASARPYLDLAVLERALVETGADAAWVGWGFVAEDPAFAELCEKIGVTFIGPSAGRDAQARRQDRREADRRGGRRAGRAVEPRRGRDPGRRAWRAAAEIGYPLMLKATAGGGGRGIRVVTQRGRARRRLRAHQPGGRAGVRQRRRVPGAPGHRRPARRGPGDRRRPGHRVGARRARLLGAAAQPEGHRGVGVAGARPRAGRRAEGVGRAAGRRGRLPRRGDRRVPLPPRRPAVRVPRGQHPAAGRAPDHRGRPPGSTWSRRSCTWPRAAGSRASRRPSAGTPSRPGSTPRTPTATSRRRPGRIARLDLPGRARASGWTPASARATPSRPTSTR